MWLIADASFLIRSSIVIFNDAPIHVSSANLELHLILHSIEIDTILFPSHSSELNLIRLVLNVSLKVKV